MSGEGVQEGGRARPKPRCSEVCRPGVGPALHVSGGERRGFRLRAEAVGRAASLGGTSTGACGAILPTLALPTRDT